MTDSNGPTIRNLRYQPWPAFAVKTAEIVPIAAGWIWLFDDGDLPLGMRIAYCVAALLVIGALTWQLDRAPFMHPVKRLELGEKLTVFPKKHQIPFHAVKRIEFAPDPAEDYVDLPLPARLCEVTITVHQWLRFRLILDMADAVRLEEWAAARGIMIDPALATLIPGRRQ